MFKFCYACFESQVVRFRIFARYEKMRKRGCRRRKSVGTAELTVPSAKYAIPRVVSPPQLAMRIRRRHTHQWPPAARQTPSRRHPPTVRLGPRRNGGASSSGRRSPPLDHVRMASARPVQGNSERNDSERVARPAYPRAMGRKEHSISMRPV